jgi:hypothetical protein
MRTFLLFDSIKRQVDLHEKVTVYREQSDEGVDFLANATT